MAPGEDPLAVRVKEEREYEDLGGENQDEDGDDRGGAPASVRPANFPCQRMDGAAEEKLAGREADERRGEVKVLVQVGVEIDVE